MGYPGARAGGLAVGAGGTRQQRVGRPPSLPGPGGGGGGPPPGRPPPPRPPTPTIPPTQWSELVASLTKAYPEAAALCIADLLNEPDAFGVRWEAQGDKPGAGDLYLAAMDAVHAVNPGMLFMVEGCGQNGLAQNWGDGLATDPALVSERGLSDPNPFFTGLLAKPYAGQVVVGPHVYPPSVTHSTYAIQART